MKRYIKYILLGFGSFFLLGSCESFLDEVPDNRTEIDSADKIMELLTGAYPEGNYFMVTESMSDNVGEKSTEPNNDINTEMYHWRDFNDDRADTPTYYWNACYKAIAQANHALEAIEALEGGNEFDAYKGEALLARAYAHFMLVSLWGKPYNPETAENDMGIPVVTEPEKEVLKDYKRNSVKEVYEQIEKDITKGIPLLDDSQDTPKFHFTPLAGKAFASRFYLFKGEWDKVVQYTGEVLGNIPSKNLRSWNDEYVGLQYAQIRIRYQSSEEPANLLISHAHSLYARTWYTITYGLSTSKSNELFTAASNPIGKNWAYPIFGPENLKNIPKFDEYFKSTNLSAGIGVPYAMSVLLTYDEVLLNRAEAYIMLNDTNAAIEDINTFFSKKTLGYSESDTLPVDDIRDFYPTQTGEFNPFYDIPDNHLPFIKCITELRRREFYHEGMRWLDNKRFNMEVIHSDSFGNTSILPADDPRRELQIPQSAVSLGLSPNPR